MKISNHRFEESDTKTRKRHEVVLTTDSPDSISSEMELSAGDIIHTVPSEKALADKAERQAQKAKAEASDIVEEAEGAKNTVEEAVSEENTVEEAISEESAIVEGSNGEQGVVIAEASDEATEEEKPIEEKTAEESAPIVVKKKKRFRLSLTERKALSGWLFVLPFVIGILFVYAPIVFDSIQISLSDYTLLPGRMELEWNGFANYKYLFAEDGDPYFSITIVDGIKDLLLQIPAIVIFSLFMAIILNQKMTGRAAFRAIFFLPVILSTGIIDAIDTKSAFMQAVSESQGGVDNNTGEESGGIMSAMDLEAMLSGIKIGTELVTYVVSLVNNIFDIVSRSGVQMLIFLSGLQSISPAIYESCEVEGASAWETFWKITLPMISPMILVNAIYTVIDAFTAADNRVMIYIEKIYSQSKFAISSAMSWVYVGVVLLFIILVALIMKTVVFYQRRD
jgi:ABC-type sugar transport system permease subunit